MTHMKLLDANAIAAQFELTAEHVRDRLSKRRDFPPAYRIGGQLRWKAEEIEAWVESRRLAPSVRKPRRRKEAVTT
jgi:prophage regulatory protein